MSATRESKALFLRSGGELMIVAKLQGMYVAKMSALGKRQSTIRSCLLQSTLTTFANLLGWQLLGGGGGAAKDFNPWSALQLAKCSWRGAYQGCLYQFERPARQQICPRALRLPTRPRTVQRMDLPGLPATENRGKSCEE